MVDDEVAKKALADAEAAAIGTALAWPTGGTVMPSTLAFTPTMYPMATCSRARVYANNTLIRNPAASHDTCRRRPRGSKAAYAVAAGSTDRGRPRTVLARRIAWPSLLWWREEVVVGMCEVQVVARSTGASVVDATAQGRDQRCAAMFGMVRRHGRYIGMRKAHTS
ncbi:uncharacterized protein [Triticum aestivum]|uniref:uncharacterized protein n=1 Tax=Triticum aestivum TaxID=4565 RepID=UPI001D0157B0|nr:uncharacterized protein LOC123078652 [Triticum aestivum]